MVLKLHPKSILGQRVSSSSARPHSTTASQPFPQLSVRFSFLFLLCSFCKTHLNLHPVSFAGAPNFVNILAEMRRAENFGKSLALTQSFVTATYRVRSLPPRVRCCLRY